MGLKDFILNCERYNKELRKDIEYYKNKNQRLQQKNEELKKQLSNDHQIKMKRLQQQNRKLKQQLSNSHQIKNQQKEFIEWLESNLEALEMCDRELILTNNKKEIKAYKEVLSKYKKIIGVNGN